MTLSQKNDYNLGTEADLNYVMFDIVICVNTNKRVCFFSSQ